MTAQMTDLVFDLSGDMLPVGYAYALWDALARRAPAIAGHASSGLLPLRGSENENGLVLARRAKLVLRLPHASCDAARVLERQDIALGAATLRLGAAQTRELQPYPTLHAHLVCGADDELAFMAEVEQALSEMAVQASLICGRPTRLSDGTQTLSGFSLVLHDLKPEDSLRVQAQGIGAHRRFGCGIFIPYKVITGLE